MTTLKTLIQTAANKVGVAEAAANHIANYLEKEGYEITKAPAAQTKKSESTLRVQPKPAAPSIKTS